MSRVYSLSTFFSLGPNFLRRNFCAALKDFLFLPFVGVLLNGKASQSLSNGKPPHPLPSVSSSPHKLLIFRHEYDTHTHLEGRNEPKNVLEKKRGVHSLLQTTSSPQKNGAPYSIPPLRLPPSTMEALFLALRTLQRSNLDRNDKSVQ